MYRIPTEKGKEGASAARRPVPLNMYHDQRSARRRMSIIEECSNVRYCEQRITSTVGSPKGLPQERKT